MRNLLFVSLCLLFVCSSCAPSITRGFRQGHIQTIGKEEIPPMLQAGKDLLKYNMIFDFMKKHFSGMLLVKQTGDQSIRTLFSTHFGLSLFDFEISHDTLIVHHCIEPLQKKNIQSLLHHDLSILFGLNLQQENKITLYSSTRNSEEIIYRLNDTGNNIFYRKDLVSGNLEQINTGKGFGKAIFSSDPDDSVPGNKIQIRHPMLRLSIQLEKLY